MIFEDRYINIREVMERLGLSKATIYSWAKAGTFPKQKKFGCSTRWSLHEIEEWVKTRPKGAYGEDK
jgi:excisionase family DNA binding protein